jgi:hypothetical protein
MRIAQVYNLQESIPPLNKDGLEQVVFYLVEELVALGHEVTLFTTADSKTSARQIPLWPRALSRDPYGGRVQHVAGVVAINEAFQRNSEFDIIHTHVKVATTAFLTSTFKTPAVSTFHNPIDKTFFSGKLSTGVSAIFERSLVEKL